MYEFTVTNESDISQELSIYLYQQENGYANLYYKVYETSIANSNFDSEHEKIAASSLKYSDNVDYPGTKFNNLTPVLTTNGSSITYTIVFFIKNLDENQSSSDSGKRILADVHVISKVTGKYQDTNVLSSDGNKFYVSNGIDYIAYFDDYAIVYLPNIFGMELPVFTGLIVEDGNYIVQSSTGSEVMLIPLTVSDNGNNVSFETEEGITTLTKSNE